MQNNIISEPVIISNIYTEYLSLLNKYHNIKRPSMFIRYLNINKSESIINADLNSTYKRFDTNGIKYDIYDNTPVYYTSGIVNDITEDNTYVGEHFSGNLSVTTYTIIEPHIDDIILFPYSPLNTNKEIWRVNNIRSVINAMYSNVSVRWFELTLDYAPISSIDGLNFSKYFSYLLTEEKNVPIEIYKKLILIIQKLEPILIEFNKQFNNKYELYSYNNIFPLQENQIIFNFLSNHQNNYHRYFSKLNNPFGMLKYMNNTDKSLQITNEIKSITSLVDNIKYDTTNITDILTYNGEINVFVIAKLLQLFEKFLNEIRQT